MDSVMHRKGRAESSTMVETVAPTATGRWVGPSGKLNRRIKESDTSLSVTGCVTLGKWTLYHAHSALFCEVWIIVPRP